MDASVTDAFRDLTGVAPAGVWRAPGRVNLIGEHTDYNDGFVLPFAVDLYVVAAVRLRADGGIRLRSLQLPGDRSYRLTELAPGRVTGWPAYVAGVAWALRASGVEVPGFDLVVSSSVPVGAGLSSSAAVEAVTAVALDDLLGSGLGRRRLAAACRRAENEMAGAATGVMDQMAALLAAESSAMLLDCRTLDVEQIPLRPGDAGLRIVVVDTGVRHDNADGRYADRRRECVSAAAALGVAALRDADLEQVRRLGDDVLRRRATHVVTENARVLEAARRLREGDLAIGGLLDASQRSMRDDFDISCPEIDVAVDALRAAGARGARLTGAGFGGCVLALVDDARVDEALDGARAAFARHGFGRPRAWTVAPSAAAGRVG